MSVVLWVHCELEVLCLRVEGYDSTTEISYILSFVL
jgi:hypothetical protein